MQHLVGRYDDHLTLEIGIVYLEDVNMIVAGVASELDDITRDWRLAVTIESGAIGIDDRFSLIKNIFARISHLSLIGKGGDISWWLVGDLMETSFDIV